MVGELQSHINLSGSPACASIHSNLCNWAGHQTQPILSGNNRRWSLTGHSSSGEVFLTIINRDHEGQDLSKSINNFRSCFSQIQTQNIADKIQYVTRYEKTDHIAKNKKNRFFILNRRRQHHRCCSVALYSRQQHH